MMPFGIAIPVWGIDSSQRPLAASGMGAQQWVKICSIDYCDPSPNWIIAECDVKPNYFAICHQLSQL